MSLAVEITLSVLLFGNLAYMFLHAQDAWGESGALALINLAAALMCWISLDHH